MIAKAELIPAFPNPNNTAQLGMTLQDYIAIEVLKVFIQNNDTDFEEDCEMAYVVADKMMKERNARYSNT
jgi:hypothetical protein